MVLFPIEQVRGAHLRTPEAAQILDWPEDALPLQSLLSEAEPLIHSARAEHLLGRPVWRLETENGSRLIDAVSGQSLSPLPEPLAREIAETRYAGDGELIALSFVFVPPREAGLSGGAWHAEYGPEDAASFWINGNTGEVRAVRTWLWRAFDFAWGLHIMDWDTRENFNSWWIKMTAIIALFFAMAGSALALIRLSRMIIHRPRKPLTKA